MARILVFGDSITYGRWDIKGEWADYLKSLYMEKSLIDSNSYWEVYNLGIDGDDSENLLKGFESEAKQRLKRLEEKEKVIIIFAIGINDSCFVQTKNTFLVSEENFKKNIKKLINLAQKFSSKIIFLGLIPVEEIKVTPLPWSKTGKSYKNEHIKKYDEIIKSVCEKNKIYFIEIFEDWIKTDYKNLLEDGLHPNSKGHQKIFETVKDFLIRNKII